MNLTHIIIFLLALGHFSFNPAGALATELDPTNDTLRLWVVCPDGKHPKVDSLAVSTGRRKILAHSYGNDLVQFRHLSRPRPDVDFTLENQSLVIRSGDQRISLAPIFDTSHQPITDNICQDTYARILILNNGDYGDTFKSILETFSTYRIELTIKFTLPLQISVEGNFHGLGYNYMEVSSGNQKIRFGAWPQ